RHNIFSNPLFSIFPSCFLPVFLVKRLRTIPAGHAAASLLITVLPCQTADRANSFRLFEEPFGSLVLRIPRYSDIALTIREKSYDSFVRKRAPVCCSAQKEA